MATLLTAEGWSADFAARSGHHVDVTVEPVEEFSSEQRSMLGDSLATFQLGESGTGEHLLAAAPSAGCDGAYVQALEAFIKEEQEHARLLAIVLTAMEHPVRTSHWTDTVFVFVRRMSSLRTHVLTLLVAELIALRYYSALRDGADSPDLVTVFGRIHADEIRHVEFHAQTLPPHIAAWPHPVRVAVRLLWNALVTGTSVLVAIDHRRALGLVGVGSVEFVAEVWRLRAQLDRRLFGRAIDNRRPLRS